MWAHYAQQFKGLCIAYSFPSLLQSLGNDIDFVRIYYNEGIPVIGRTSKPASELARKILSCKNHRWLYEREWRMFAAPGKVFYRDRNCVTRVYLGSRMDQDGVARMSIKLKALGIKSSMMAVKKYSIVFDTV